MKAIVIALMLIAAPAIAQERIKREQLIGAWEYDESYLVIADGTRVNQFGVKPAGLFILMENGWYSHIIMKPDLPHIAAGAMMAATPDEAKRIAVGSLAHYGTYEVDEAARTFTVRIKKSDFPNFDGRTQTRTVMELNDETLRYVNDVTNAGPGTFVIAKLRRVK